MPKILYIVQHRKDRSPGQRFRIEQYLDYLSAHGFEHTYSYVINEKDDRYFYHKGHFLYKLYTLFKALCIRIYDLCRCTRYDLVYIYREAFPIGGAFFEYLMKKRGATIVFDFDDSIWLRDVSKGNQRFGKLKRPQKTASILRLADLTFVGNAYLKQYADQYTNNAVIIPTALNPDNCTSSFSNTDRSPICIGWIGSTTTIKHLETAIPMLKQLKQKYGDQICFKVIADVPLQTTEINVENTKWTPQTEAAEISRFDIGIMPLPNDQWSVGKCGFKGLQCMAYGIPVVMSPVGVNTSIIQDGKNGFLAATPEEWIDKLSQLIASPKLRQQFAQAGRNTIVEKYSTQVWSPIIMNHLNQLLKSKTINTQQS